MRNGFTRREVLLVGIIFSLAIAWWVDHLRLIGPRDQYRTEIDSLRLDLKEIRGQFFDAAHENGTLRTKLYRALERLDELDAAKSAAANQK